jgi:O-antigen ligase
VALVGAALAWSTLAAGGVYWWSAPPLVLLTLVLTTLTRPRVAASPDTSAVDVTLLLALAAVACQLLPLPAAIRWEVSPRLDVDRLDLLLVPQTPATWSPLSLDPASTVLAFGLVTAATLVFWCSRYLCGHGHARQIVNLVGVVGVVASVAAVAQRAVDPARIYGLWLPIHAGARPMGPFVNRNHLATWLLLATPLLAGALAAAARHHSTSGPIHARLAAAIRTLATRQGWMAIALVLMTLTLVLTTSRAALAGAAAAGLTATALGLRRATRRGVVVGLGAAVILAAVTLSTIAPQPWIARAEETLALGTAGRGAIWTDARTVAGLYPLSGAGLGSFERAMLLHQSTDRRTLTNQAHNQYLQLLAEGGVLLTAPAVLVVLAYAWLAARRLRADDAPTVWLRIGSLAGLMAVAVQGLWETGLRMPANGVLFAVVAAIAVHRPRTGKRRRERGGHQTTSR